MDSDDDARENKDPQMDPDYGGGMPPREEDEE